MPELLLYRKRIDSVFQLLGEHKYDIAYSAGRALAHSPDLWQAFLDAGGQAMADLDLKNANAYFGCRST